MPWDQLQHKAMSESHFAFRIIKIRLQNVQPDRLHIRRDAFDIVPVFFPNPSVPIPVNPFFERHREWMNVFAVPPRIGLIYVPREELNFRLRIVLSEGATYACISEINNDNPEFRQTFCLQALVWLYSVDARLHGSDPSRRIVTRC